MTKKMMIAKLLGLGLVFATSTGYADKIKSSYDKAAPFSQFKTYAFKPGLLMISQDQDKLEQFIFDAMRNELNAKGMTEVKERPDVYVTYMGTLGGKAASGSLNAPAQSTQYTWGIPQGWSTVTSSAEIEGSLLLEVVNASTEKLAWQATVIGLVRNLGHLDKQQQKIQDVVKKAFKDYPPKSGK
jgi:hypothetical protein